MVISAKFGVWDTDTLYSILDTRVEGGDPGLNHPKVINYHFWVQIQAITFRVCIWSSDFLSFFKLMHFDPLIVSNHFGTYLSKFEEEKNVRNFLVVSECTNSSLDLI